MMQRDQQLINYLLVGAPFMRVNFSSFIQRVKLKNQKQKIDGSLRLLF